MKNNNFAKVGLKNIFFESIFDLLIVIVAFIASIYLLTDKLLFLFEVYGANFHSFDIFKIIVINAAAYIAVCCWLVLLFSRGSHFLIRLYILLVGLFLYSLVRVIQAGEMSTRQGVDFYLVNHLALIIFGHQEWKVFLVEWFVKLHLPVFLLVAYFLKRFLIKPVEKKGGLKQYALFIFCVLFSLLSFLTLDISGVPKSLRQNSLVYVIQSAWFPVKDIKISLSENNIFKEAIENNKVERTGHSELRNVVIFTLESTGANMLDIYSPNDSVKGSTPFLSEFAKSSLKFNQTSALMTSTTKSLVSILCGIEPYLGFESFEATLGIPVACLPKRLSQLGYETAYFQSATKLYENRDLLAVNMGFENFISLEDLPANERKGATKIGLFGSEDKVLLKESERWVQKQRQKEQPFLAFYLTLAQHHPYLPVKNEDKKNKEQAPQNDGQRFQKNYSHSLSYIDSYLKEIVNQYKQAGLYENTLFIVLGDHGEAFGIHHPQRFHNNNLYREGEWVPFFIVNEKLFPRTLENNEVLSLIDVAPTIEHLLGLRISEAYRGRSALNTIHNKKIYAACWYKNRCLAVMDDHYKYIYNFDDAPEELYARKIDFWEERNLAQEHPELLKQYRKNSFDWYGEVMYSYHAYYQSMNENYLHDAASYYHFPFEFFTNKLQVKTW